MRNISFAITTKQFNDKSKTVTRRMGWKNLKQGERLRGVLKAMGLKNAYSFPTGFQEMNGRKIGIEWTDPGDKFIGLNWVVVGGESGPGARAMHPDWARSLIDQLDADAFWRSSGNRYITPEQLKQWGLDKVQKWWKEFNSNIVYDYDAHVELLQSLDDHKKLSRTFTTIPLRSNSEFIWNDVNRMHGLNMEQSRRKQQNHICPMPFDQVDRLIELYSNPGDVILDPFGGLGTTGVRAVKKGRKAILTELNEVYAKCGAIYLKETEQKAKVPTLFDLIKEAV